MEKLPSGKWRERADYTDKDGKRRQKSFTGVTKKEVKDKIAEWRMAQREEKEAHPTVTVLEAARQYVAAKEAVLSPSTIREYFRMLRGGFGDIENKDVELLTSKDVQVYISCLALGHSPKTVRNCWGLLRAAIKFVAPEKQLAVTLPAKKTVKRTVPTEAQLQRLIREADPDLRKAIVLGSLSLRRGEACALKYADVNPSLRTICVHSDKVMDRHGAWVVKDMPKTSQSVRTIYVPKEVVEMIWDADADLDSFVVPITPDNVTARFIRLRDRLGIDVSFHSLRRYCASLLHSMGVPDKYIQRVGGWSSPDVMRTCYTHVMDDKMAEFTMQMTERYSGTLSGTSDDGGTESQEAREAATRGA